MDSPSSGQGQGQVVNWYHPMNNSTHLPPKSPGYSMFEGSSLFQGGSIFSERVSFPIRGGGHKRTPSAGYLPQVQPSSLEEILESADGDVATVKKGSHRRSSSDSAAFSESPYQLDSIVNPFTAEEEYYAQEAPGQHILRHEISDCNRSAFFQLTFGRRTSFCKEVKLESVWYCNNKWFTWLTVCIDLEVESILLKLLAGSGSLVTEGLQY